MTPRLAGVVAAFLLWPCLLAAQRPEPYQTISSALGWGAIGPVEDTELEGEAADAGASVQFALDLDLRRHRLVYLYAHLEADNADVRQHLAVSGGARLRFVHLGRLRPYLGGGVGILWLEPKITTGLAVEREFVLRGEGQLGAEWLLVPGLGFFGEYRLTGARYPEVVSNPNCSIPGRCVEQSREAVLHVGHSGWLGLRIKIF